jgi:hypothetical protein
MIRLALAIILVITAAEIAAQFVYEAIHMEIPQ